jgi:hypothetical protein
VTQSCDHVETDVRVSAPLGVCSSCVEIGATWVDLRPCLSGGRTSWGDASPNRHATAHFHPTGHPMVRTAEPDEEWQWCCSDDRLYLAGQPGDAAAGE